MTEAPTSFGGIALSVFASRLAAICDEMGALLRRRRVGKGLRN